LLAYWPGLEAVSSVVHLAPNARLGETGDDRDRLDRLGIRPPYVVNVGTIEPRKNLSVLLDAMLELPEVTLVQCGPVGWNVDVLVRRTKTMPNVKLLGYVDEATLGQLYRGALAAVFPSLYEGIHLPTLDASSLGCPVVVSDIPVHREILGEAALYFPANRPGAAAARLRLLLGEPGERAKRSALGRRRAAEFSWDRAAQRLAQVLRHVAGARWSSGEP
jgi:glycosyltransferase involved in cell wall biosynthesis